MTTATTITRRADTIATTTTAVADRTSRQTHRHRRRVDTSRLLRRQATVEVPEAAATTVQIEWEV